MAHETKANNELFYNSNYMCRKSAAYFLLKGTVDCKRQQFSPGIGCPGEHWSCAVKMTVFKVVKEDLAAKGTL